MAKTWKLYVCSECLEHSLQEFPKDIEIIEGKAISEIIEDNNFKKAISGFINENKKYNFSYFGLCNLIIFV